MITKIITLSLSGGIIFFVSNSNIILEEKCLLFFVIDCVHLFSVKMAPLRTTSRLTISAVNTKKTTTNAVARGTTALLLAKNAKETRSKRKAISPAIKESSRKRSALGDLTNKTDRPAVDTKAKGVKNVLAAKKVTVQQKVLPSVKTAVRVRHNENLGPPAAPAAARVQTRAAARASLPNETAQKPKDNAKETAGITKVKRLSNEFEKTEESLYSTALEDMLVFFFHFNFSLLQCSLLWIDP